MSVKPFFQQGDAMIHIVAQTISDNLEKTLLEEVDKTIRPRLEAIVKDVLKDFKTRVEAYYNHEHQGYRLLIETTLNKVKVE
jgi:hypothetical protein